MKNRLNYWRHMHQMERDEWTVYLGVAYHQYTRWENNKVQPSLDKLILMWKRIRERFPDANLQDLLEDF